MKNSSNMDAKKFAWTYLVEHGFGGVKPSYYGGWDIVDTAMKKRGFSYTKIHEKYLNEINKVGVDWDKTNAPSSDSVSEFQGTFCDATLKEVIRGNLVLNDGTVQVWYADAISVSNVFEMMARADVAKEKFHRFFEKNE